MIRVILCDDHALIRRGIRDTLSDAEDSRRPAFDDSADPSVWGGL